MYIHTYTYVYVYKFIVTQIIALRLVWQLLTVTDMNECDERTYDCHENATCSNVVGGFNNCTCDTGFTGNATFCEGELFLNTLWNRMLFFNVRGIGELTPACPTTLICHSNTAIGHTPIVSGFTPLTGR